MEIKYKNGKPIHPDFDGHLEKPLSKMTPKEKLDYLWMAIEFRDFVKKHAKFVEKLDKEKIIKN
ncbi:MAG: hypothetical protein L0Y76_06560 [Ignavibacteria bacterium]|nr:hypothetical protein [Ignavibacteria bacterium]